jgi:hypothetical protein
MRPANDSVRPMSTVELALKLQPTSQRGTWRLDPQYEAWLAQHFPRDRVHFCPLVDYDRLVRPADASCTLEDVVERQRREAPVPGGYRIDGLGVWRPRSAMFVVGSTRLKALLEFLFAFG